MESIRRLDPRWLALAGGAAYALGVTLVGTQADTDPVGASYDALNRVLTLALALLFVGAIQIARRLRSRGLPGARAATAIAAGFGLGLLGNLIEFWGSLIAGRPTEATAERIGASDAFAGSFPGFLIFVLGGVVILVAGVLLARAIVRWPGGGTAAVAGAALLGPLNIAAGVLWAVSPLAAAVPGVLFALAWLSVTSAAQARTEEAGRAVPAPAGRAARQ